MYKRVAINGLAVLGLLAGASAYADHGPGFYAGVGLGDATVVADDVGIMFDESDSAFKVFGGYSFSEHIAVELTYFDGGSPSQHVDFGFSSGTVEAEISGLNVSAIGRIPLGDVFSLFGRVGLATYDVNVTARIDDVSASDDSSDNDLSYGFGAAFSFLQSFEVRAEYEAVDVSNGDFNTVSISGLFKF
jgi:OOP family OmpA-OmpF porin